MVNTDSKQLDYFASNKKQNRRFFCQPALNLFEHFTVFQTIPHERYDIVRCLDKYFNRNTPENAEAEEFIPVLFKVVEVPWQSSETDSPKTADFPSLSEYELEYYDIWQLKFIHTLLQHQIEIDQHMEILQKVTCPTLTKLYDHKKTLEDALKILKRHAFLSAGCHNIVGIRQNEFLFFKDYVEAVTANVDNQIRIDLVPVNMYNPTLYKQIEDGLCLGTKQWINEKTAQGMQWHKIMEFIELKENYIATAMIKEQEQKTHPPLPEQPDPTEEKENILANKKTERTSAPETELYCTHHRINTHNSVDCYALNSRAKVPSTPGNSQKISVTGLSGAQKQTAGYKGGCAGFEEILGMPQAKGIINKIRVYFTINASIDCNLMSTAAQKLLGLPDLFDTRSKRVFDPLGGQIELTSVHTQAEIQLAIYSQCQSVQKFMIYPHKDVKVILGMQWIRSNYTMYILHLVPVEKRKEVISGLLKHQTSPT
ncbi:hypothetical protein NEAUS03_1558 [Nematocida ausubeli]|nr:hypothetical protein NEAUS03_1558 [Nematocida ausubeli]